MKRLGTAGLAAASAGAFALATLAFAHPASAHGYVFAPESRAYLCQTGVNMDCGPIQYEPHSLEGRKGFPQVGPADGKIASAGGLFGGFLDEQTATRWAKTDIAAGPLMMDWSYSAPHATSKWHYYMTKPGWNPNKPLARADFELITTVAHDGTEAITNPDHTMNVPADRSGYHVILAVWDIADTPNAFYHVIDVNVLTEGRNVIAPPDGPEQAAIVIAGSRSKVRGKNGVKVTGIASGLESSSRLRPFVKMRGQSEYQEGRALVPVDYDGDFVWQRRTGKKTYVYMQSEDGSVRSTRVVISESYSGS